jgi:hypothetical protein
LALRGLPFGGGETRNEKDFSLTPFTRNRGAGAVRRAEARHSRLLTRTATDQFRPFGPAGDDAELSAYRKAAFLVVPQLAPGPRGRDGGLAKIGTTHRHHLGAELVERFAISLVLECDTGRARKSCDQGESHLPDVLEANIWNAPQGKSTLTPSWILQY